MVLALAFIMAVAAIFSDTAVGRALRAALANVRLPRLTRGRLAVAVFLFAFTVTLVALLKTDGLALAARAMPDGVAWFAAFDVATYLDVVAFTALAALALRLRVVWTFVRGAAARCDHVVRTLRRRWATRSHRTTLARTRKPSDDDIGWAGAAFA